MKDGGTTLFILLLCTVLCSCASLTPVPEWKYEQNAIHLHYESDAQLNNFEGNPHTLMLCVYQLKDPNAFNQLMGEDEGLSKLLDCSNFDLSVTNSKRMVIYPGRGGSMPLDRAESTKFVGIIAGYYTLQKEHVARLYAIPVSSIMKNPMILEINLYLGPQKIQEFR